MKNTTSRNITWFKISGLLTFTVLLSSCFQSTSTLVKEPQLIKDQSILTDDPDKQPLLIIRVKGKTFEQVVVGLTEELSEEFFLHQLIIDKGTQPQQITPTIQEISPQMVVLMDNLSINLYKKYQRQLPQSATIIPSVSVMASFMDMAIKDLKNATGIFYEVPLVTSVVNLRAILSTHTFDKVGVVHREFMGPAITLNQQYCAKEDIQLITYTIPNQGNIKSKLTTALSQLTDQVDAFWIPNDNKLINAELFNSVWLSFAKKFRKPIITGVENLVEPKFEFGTFAVIPDALQLGIQTAQIIFEAMDNDWQVETQVLPPLSVYKIINLEQAQHLFKIDQEKLQNMVDKVLTKTQT